MPRRCDVREQFWQLDTRCLPCAFLAAGRVIRCTDGTLRGALDNGPHYPLNVLQDINVEMQNNAEFAELKSGSLSVRVAKASSGHWIFLRNGVRIW